MQKAATYLAIICLSAILTACNAGGALTPPMSIGSGTENTQTNIPTQDQTIASANDNASQDMTPLTAEEDMQISEPANTGGPMLGKNSRVAARQQSIFQAPAGNAPAASTGGSVRFLPVIGAPIEVVTPLSKELVAAARQNGLEIRGSGDSTASHMLKGYFSAFEEGQNTTVVYVWDVLDNAGARLHRVQGQETVAGKSSDKWSVVGEDVMRKIADDTIRAYILWKNDVSG